MGIFDKGFNPLKEIQKASKAAGDVASRIAEGASGMAVAAGAAIVDTTTTAGEAASRIADEASEAATTAGAAIVDAATTAGRGGRRSGEQRESRPRRKSGRKA